MTYKILTILLWTIPFVVVRSDWECFRGIKESVFQIGAMLLLASSFFDTRVRTYKNKYLSYIICYIAFLFARFYVMDYLWGGLPWRRMINVWTLIPIFNTILGIIILKTIIEYLRREHVIALMRTICLVTVVISFHLIFQKLGLFQIYGHEDFTKGGSWVAQNRVIAFLGNPMVAGSFVSIAAQFNLFFDEKKHYLAYILAFVAIACTTTTSPMIAFLSCSVLYTWFKNRKLSYCIIGGTVAVVSYLVFHFQEYFSFNDRLEVWGKTIEMWQAKPYTGLGLGNFRIHNLLVKTTNWWQVHSEPLQILHEMGIIGLGLVGMLVWNFFRTLTKHKNVYVCALVVLAGIINCFMSFPLHLASVVYLIILGFGFTEIFNKEEL